MESIRYGLKPISKYGKHNMRRHGTVIETDKWKIKIYGPPREHGSPHVHVISKSDNAEVKIYLRTLELEGKTRFSKKAIKQIIRYIYDNYDILMDFWEELHEDKKKAQHR